MEYDRTADLALSAFDRAADILQQLSFALQEDYDGRDVSPRSWSSEVDAAETWRSYGDFDAEDCDPRDYACGGFAKSSPSGMATSSDCGKRVSAGMSCKVAEAMPINSASSESTVATSMCQAFSIDDIDATEGRDEEVGRLRTLLQERDEQIAHLQQRDKERDGELQRTNALLSQRNAEIAELRSALEVARRVPPAADARMEAGWLPTAPTSQPELHSHQARLEAVRGDFLAAWGVAQRRHEELSSDLRRQVDEVARYEAAVRWSDEELARLSPCVTAMSVRDAALRATLGAAPSALVNYRY